VRSLRSVAGVCYLCRLPVSTDVVKWVVDPKVKHLDGQPVRRLAHRGECARELRHRLGGAY